MKARLFYLATMLMTMFAITSCNNDDEFPEMSEEFLNKSIIIKELSSVRTIMDNPELSCKEWKHDYKSYYTCFYSVSELEDSPYASLMDELPDVDWNEQTLVIGEVYAPIHSIGMGVMCMASPINSR